MGAAAEAERLAQAEAELLLKEEADRKAAEELDAARRAQEELERQAKEKANQAAEQEATLLSRSAPVDDDSDALAKARALAGQTPSTNPAVTTLSKPAPKNSSPCVLLSLLVLVAAIIAYFLSRFL